MLRLQTRLFELLGQKHCMAELAALFGLSLSQMYRIKHGQRGINEQFIVGALTSFPQYKFEELFYIDHKARG